MTARNPMADLEKFFAGTLHSLTTFTLTMSLALDFLLPPPPASYKTEQSHVVHAGLSGNVVLYIVAMASF